MAANNPDHSRRQFLKIAIFAGAGMTVSTQLPGCSGEKQQVELKIDPDQGHLIPNAWIKIYKDDRIQVRVNHSEMGQGITTALPMIIAEELEADWHKVAFEIAPVADVYKHPSFGIQWTVSSKSVESAWDILRQAGAGVRALFIAAAADSWKIPEKECRVENSRVFHDPTNRSLRYGQLIEKVAAVPVPEKAPLKTFDTFRLIGRPVHRLDNREKIRGTAVFGTDVKLPGMLMATVVHPPVFGAGVTSFNRQETMALPGIKDVFPIETGIAVVAMTFWQALKAIQTLAVEWEPHKNQAIDSDQLFKRWAKMGKQKGKAFFKTGDSDKAFEKSGIFLESVYDLPYQAHGTPEPMNCTAEVTSDACKIWAPTQNQKGAQEIAARITGLDNASIRVYTTYLGGGFGRRALVDYVGEAVEISQRMKAPVKVIWTREEDIQRDFFRPASHHVMKALVNSRGIPIAWQHRIVGADVFGQVLPKVISAMLPDAVPRFIKNTATSLAHNLMPRLVAGRKGVVGAGPLPYAFENMRVEFIHDDPGIPICWWRSVAPASNCFAVECFIDEIAYKVNRDPFELRCDILAASPRLLAVLKLAAKKANWIEKSEKNVYQGIACHNFHETMMAMVAEVFFNPRREIRVHRVVCALDCGIAINPKIIEAQVQSGVAFGLTATLKSAISIRKGMAQQSNFDDFPILRMDEMPMVETYIVPSTNPPTGIGETAVPVIGPAVANAVFAATGKQVRRLPILPEIQNHPGKGYSRT